MHTHTRRVPRMDINDVCILLVMSSLNDPVDIVRAAVISHCWRRLVIEHGLCKRLFMERFPHVNHVAYEARGRYRIIRLADVLIGDDLEREHRIYSYLLQPRTKLMDCPWGCLLFPVGASSTRCIAENILTTTTPVVRYPVGYSFLANEGKSLITETRIDFLQCLESDVCVSIMSFLDDPADLVRVSAVSRFWRQFVIANGLAKKWCLKLLPQLSAIAGVDIETETSTATKPGFIERDHTVYTSLLRAITKSKVFRRDLIKYAVSASSTDKFPNQSICQTLHYRDLLLLRPSYWSSKGQSNPDVPETLIYKLEAGLWLITEIDIQPYKACFQHRMPICSARSVRFRMGHPKSANEFSSDPKFFPLPNGADDKFVWTYTSPEFPMLQVELLGRVQRKESDGLFYICVNHVKVVGRPLFPAFETEIEEASGEMWLRYYPEFLCSIMKRTFLNDLEEDMLPYPGPFPFARTRP